MDEKRVAYSIRRTDSSIQCMEVNVDMDVSVSVKWVLSRLASPRTKYQREETTEKGYNVDLFTLRPRPRHHQRP